MHDPSTRPPTLSPVVALLAILSSASVSTAAELPDTIDAPKGLNLGSTSFFDGFGRTSEGWTLLEYGRYESLRSIDDAAGDRSPYFLGTRITVYVALTQISYTSDWHPMGGDAVGFSAALPVIDFKSSFAPQSPVSLGNNGVNIGDLVWGPTYQSRMYESDGHPYFAWRAQLIVASPTGAVNETKNINQGSGFWAVNPYVTFTILPATRIEISNRLNYQYNLPSSRFSNPPQIPGVTYVNGQAGRLIYDNFDASALVAARLHLGLAGYWLDQLNSDQTNQVSVPNSRVRALYLGPGGRIELPNADTLNLNLYLALISQNDVSGVKFSFQYVHRFP